MKAPPHLLASVRRCSWSARSTSSTRGHEDLAAGEAGAPACAGDASADCAGGVV